MIMTHPSLSTLSWSVFILAVWSLAMALAVFLLMQFRHQRQLARESRRMMLIDLLVPDWDGQVLREMWTASRRLNREVLQEVVVARRQALEGEYACEFERVIIHAGIFELWLEQLRGGTRTRRVRAAMHLGLVRDPRSVEALVAATRDSAPEVVVAAVLSLGRLRIPRGLPGLMGLAQRPLRALPDLTLAAALAACAGECPQLLAPLLRTPEVRSRLVGAWALSEVANEAVLGDLLAASDDAEAEVRAKVARALARISTPASLECLRRLARDPVWFVRVRALDALGRLGAGESESAAFAALGDDVREVRSRAAFALWRIGRMKRDVVKKVLATGSRKSFESLISEWERAGFLWKAADGLAPLDPARFRESEDLVRTLAAAGVTEGLTYLVGVHPNLKVRLRLLRLLTESPRPSVRRQLEVLGCRPDCDPRVAAGIRVRLSRTPTTPASAA
jgi:uncharacterized membrane protein